MSALPKASPALIADTTVHDFVPRGGAAGAKLRQNWPVHQEWLSLARAEWQAISSRPIQTHISWYPPTLWLALLACWKRCRRFPVAARMRLRRSKARYIRWNGTGPAR